MDAGASFRSLVLSFGLGCVTTWLALRVWTTLDWKVVAGKPRKISSGEARSSSAMANKPVTELPRLSRDDETYAYTRRRTSVAGESINPADEDEEEGGGGSSRKRIHHPKAPETRKHLIATIQKNLLMRNLDLSQKQEIIDAMFDKAVKKGENIITQGEEGDYFYVVDSGRFEIFVDDKRVAESLPGGSFGELALLYGTPRAATVRASEDSVVWGVDRLTFRRIVMKSTFKKRKRHEEFLRGITLFSSLNDGERVKLADALQPVHFDADEVIITEGELGDVFYIVEEGVASVVRQNGEGRPEEVKKIQSGGYFGEIALLTDGYRMASVVAKSSLQCLVLDKASFDRLLGPCVDILKRNMEAYKLYENQIAQS